MTDIQTYSRYKVDSKIRYTDCKIAKMQRKFQERSNKKNERESQLTIHVLRMPVSKALVKRTRNPKRKSNTKMAEETRKIARRQAVAVVRRAKELQYFLASNQNEQLQYNTSVPYYKDAMMRIPQGDGISSMTGHKIQAKYLKIKLILDNVENNGAHDVVVRVAVLKVRQGSAYTEYQTGTDIFEINNSKQSMGTYSGPLDTVAKWNHDRYIPVVDEWFTMSYQNSGERPTVAKEYHIDLHNAIMDKYGNTTANVLDQYVLLVICRRVSGTDATANALTLSYLSEFGYTEY